MPYGSWINDLPTAFFMVVHIAAFAIGAGFAWLAFKRELTLLGTAFTLFAAAVWQTAGARRPVTELTS